MPVELTFPYDMFVYIYENDGSIPIPTIVRINDLIDKPASNDIEFRTEWKKDWINIIFDTLVKKLKKEPA